jgi:hypothetical protein
LEKFNPKLSVESPAPGSHLRPQRSEPLSPLHEPSPKVFPTRNQPGRLAPDDAGWPGQVVSSNPVIRLQRAVGNRATGRWLGSHWPQAKRYHRSADDLVERKAGRIAEPMMQLQRACACGGECDECRKKQQLGLQAKLTVGKPGDIYEQEADRIADQVISPPAQSIPSGATPHIQRVAGPAPEQSDAAPASVDRALASPGMPLDPALRQDMEQHFGRDFSGVRVHADTVAAQSAQDVNAKAYTVGRDLVFGAGCFSPGTHEGRRLLAHELTHVVQQGASGSTLQRSPDKTGDLPPLPRAPHPIELMMPPDAMCPSGQCFTDEQIYGDLDRQQEQEKRAAEEKERKEDEERHDRLMILRKMLSGHIWYAKSVILDLLKSGGMRDLMIVRYYGCEMPGLFTHEQTYQKCVIQALDKYEADWQKAHHVAGQHVVAPDIKAEQEHEKTEETWAAGAEGTEYVTESVLAGAGAAVTSQFTDDPKRIAAGAGIGAALSGVFGSVASAKGQKGSYVPKVVRSPQAPASVGPWRYGKPAISGPSSESTAPIEARPDESTSEPLTLAGKSPRARSGINWNPFKGRSLADFLPLSQRVTAHAFFKGRPNPVEFLGLVTTAKGGRVWVSTDAVTHSHIEDLVNQLQGLGKPIEIVTGTHGSRAGYLSKEINFLVEDYGIAPAAKNITIHNAATMSNAELKAVLESGGEVILAWCDSEFSRRILVALGMNFRKAPF